MGLGRLPSRAVPGAVLLVAAAVLSTGESRLPWAPAAVCNAMMALFALVALLGIVFRRARVVEASLVMAAATLAALVLPAGSDDSGLPTFARNATAVVLPLSLAWIVLRREGSVLTERGVLRLLGLLGPPLAMAYVWVSYQDGVIKAVARPLPSQLGVLSTLPVVGVMSFLVGGLVVAIQLVRTRGPIELGLLWALLAGYLSLDRTAGAGVNVAFAAAGGIALAAALVQALFAMAFLDALTGLPSRRAMDEALGTLGPHFAVAMIDVDHFKACNDTYGHDVGDQVLRMVASKLSGVGGGGRVYRYGGEEFAVLFPGLEAQEALPHVEALREAVAESPFTLRGADRPAEKPASARPAQTPREAIRVTVSAGVAEHREGDSPAEVFRAADAALYGAKAAGRNRVKAI